MLFLCKMCDEMKKWCVSIVCVFFVLESVLCMTSHLVQNLPSPCPDYFEYRTDRSSNLLFGMLQINSPKDTPVIHLIVEMSIGNSVQNYNGNIELAFPKEQVIDDILHNRPILYKIFFPAWRNIPPKITKIYVNGNLICSGPKIAIQLVQILSTVTLEHTLTINVKPTDNGNRFENQPTFNLDSNPIFGTNLFTPTTESRPLNTPLNTINFNPQMPKDPSSVFSNNPFLSNKNMTGYPYNWNLFLFKPNEIQNPFIKYPQNPFFNMFNRNTPRPGETTTHSTILSNPFLETLTTHTPDLNDRYKPQFGFEIPNRNENPQINFPQNKNEDRNENDFLTNSVQSQSTNSCGRPVATNSLIVDGLAIPKGAYPWLTAIFRVQKTEGLMITYICSGTLISHKHVVTAAHCVNKNSRKLKPSELLIVLGKYNIAKWASQAKGEKMIEPEEIHVHKDYDSSTGDADIAVVVLSETVEFTALISPICLWSGSTDLNQIVGNQGVVAGWGKNEDGEISTAEPKQTKLPVVNQETCLRSSHQFQFITSNRTFCAGFRNGSGPCNGDSGSGLVMQRDGVWMLRGVVSMSISDTHTRTCDLNHYVVFTDASKFLQWLASFLSS